MLSVSAWSSNSKWSKYIYIPSHKLRFCKSLRCQILYKSHLAGCCYPALHSSYFMRNFNKPFKLRCEFWSNSLIQEVKPEDVVAKVMTLWPLAVPDAQESSTLTWQLYCMFESTIGCYSWKHTCALIKHAWHVIFKLIGGLNILNIKCFMSQLKKQQNNNKNKTK